MAIAASPYWGALPLVPAAPAVALPARVDALVIGAGYTGLAAARELAAAGRHVLVIDSGDPGGGCSGRNGGQVAYSFKPSGAELAARYGAEVATGICRDGQQALAHLRGLAQGAGLDMDWRGDGAFVGAHTPRAYAAMVRDAQTQPWGYDQRPRLVPRERQREEIATDFYHGGCVFPDDASVDPARLFVALHARAVAAGATVVGHCAATGLQRGAAGFEVATARGTVQARQVLLATNGYGGALSPWHQRRVIPIGSYQIATEPLGQARVRELLPQRRNVGDSRRVVVYYLSLIHI